MDAYKKVRESKGKPTRVVILMPTDEVRAIDDWAIPAGHLNRTSAFRHLLQVGLDAVKATATAAAEQRA
ncbi:hypothetical protein [Rhodovulum sp. PH10]|uniref:hypothetical protein n=1 Tax=Rhodovulum sp. PH10 TaxID=1187851 RepID=UPI00058C6676|nr:hypothetical protein [Rhodovulum sp. PH10]